MHNNLGIAALNGYDGEPVHLTFLKNFNYLICLALLIVKVLTVGHWFFSWRFFFRSIRHFCISRTLWHFFRKVPRSFWNWHWQLPNYGKSSYKEQIAKFRILFLQNQAKLNLNFLKLSCRGHLFSVSGTFFELFYS